MQMEANFQKAADYIRSASGQGAHLAVLPEYHLLNWVPHDAKFKEACSHWKTYLQKYQDLAKECNINLVPGTLVELHDQGTENERLFNVAYFIDNTGEIVGKYQKKNLWGSIERDHLISSSMDPHIAFDTPLGKVGMLICWDLAFPEAFRELISQGAKLIIIPTFWTLSDCSKEGLAINPTSEGLFLDSMLTARCFENTCGKSALISTQDQVVKHSNSCSFRQRRWATRKGLCWPLAGLHSVCRRHHKTRQSRRRHGSRGFRYASSGACGRELSSTI